MISVRILSEVKCVVFRNLRTLWQFYKYKPMLSVVCFVLYTVATMTS